MAAKRNPGIAWGVPLQGQGARQQARFLLLIEQAAAIRRGFGPGCSVVANPITRAVLEVAGVPLDQLDGRQGELTYHSQLVEVIKAAWKENKKHPHYAVMQEAKESLSGLDHVRFMARCLDLDHDYRTEEAASQQSKYRHDGMMPSVTLAYRHLIPEYAKQLVSNGGDLKLSGLWFDVDALASIKAAVVPAKAKIEAECEVIREKRSAEYKERFGHQPSADNDKAEQEQMWYEVFGKTSTEYMQDIFAGHYPGSRDSGGTDVGNMRHFGAPSLSDYRALGLSVGASQAAIQSAYRRLAKQHHPDTGGNVDRFRAVAEAYGRLRAAAEVG